MMTVATPAIHWEKLEDNIIYTVDVAFLSKTKTLLLRIGYGQQFWQFRQIEVPILSGERVMRALEDEPGIDIPENLLQFPNIIFEHDTYYSGCEIKLVYIVTYRSMIGRTIVPTLHLVLCCPEELGEVKHELVKEAFGGN